MFNNDYTFPIQDSSMAGAASFLSPKFTSKYPFFYLINYSQFTQQAMYLLITHATVEHISNILICR